MRIFFVPHEYNLKPTLFEDGTSKEYEYFQNIRRIRVTERLEGFFFGLSRRFVIILGIYCESHLGEQSNKLCFLVEQRDPSQIEEASN